MTTLQSRHIMFRIHGHPLWAHPPNGQKDLGRSVSCLCRAQHGFTGSGLEPQSRQPDSLTRPDSPGSLGEPGLSIAIRWPSSTSGVDASQAAV